MVYNGKSILKYGLFHEKSILTWTITRGTPISGSLQMSFVWKPRERHGQTLNPMVNHHFQIRRINSHLHWGMHHFQRSPTTSFPQLHDCSWIFRGQRPQVVVISNPSSNIARWFSYFFCQPCLNILGWDDSNIFWDGLIEATNQLWKKISVHWSHQPCKNCFSLRESSSHF